MRKFPPLAPTHPIVGEPCAACKEPFKAGDELTLVALGPGNDSQARAHARAGRAYTAVTAPCHWACVTGEEE